MKKTTNYHLNQWEKQDRVLMEDFNADNQKIDEIIAEVAAGRAKIIVGEYDGEASGLGYGEGRAKDIALGFHPKALFITTGSSFNSATAALLFGHMQIVTDGKVICQITDNGFTVGTGRYENSPIYPELNSKNQHYSYLAIG